MTQIMPVPVMDLPDLPDTPAAGAAELFQQLDLITRRLQHALGQIDAMPRLQHTARGLPDARGRLGLVVDQAGAAADKVLNAVERAKLERSRIAAAAQRLMHEPAEARRVVALAAEMESAAARIDAQLTDIMVAQDFHDLGGQMLRKVVALMTELEGGLLQLLGDTATLGAECSAQANAQALSELAHSQREVDELLANHGF